MVVAGQQLSLAEFLALPEQEPPLELIDGVVYQKVSPQGKHGRLEYKLARLFDEAAGDRDQIIVVPELRGTYRSDSLVPDVAVYRRERVSLDEDGELTDDVTVPPDLTIEIRSPGQGVRRTLDKCRRYIASGTAISLFVDPERRTVTRFDANGTVVLRGEERIDLDALFPDLNLTVADVFALLKLRS